MAYCGECKTDTDHVVLEAVGMQIRSIRCTKCNHEGAYRSPLAKTKAALMEYAKRKKKGSGPQKTVRRTRKKAPSPEEIFYQLVDGMDLSEARSYNIKEDLIRGDLIRHPSFGLGVVTEKTDKSKAKVSFETGERILICNRQ